MVSNAAFAESTDSIGTVKRTIDLPYPGVERMVWSDDGTKIAVLLSDGAYVADVRDGRRLLEVWGGPDDDQGRIGDSMNGDVMLAFTPDGQRLIAPLHTGGKIEVLWQKSAESTGQYLFTVVNIASGVSDYIFSDRSLPGKSSNDDVARDGPWLIAQIGSTGYFCVYRSDQFDQTVRYLGPIQNRDHNSLGVKYIYYDNIRSNLVVLYIDGEIKVWDTAENKEKMSFFPSITGFRVAALDRATGNLCTGGNGLIKGGGRDDPATLVRCWNLQTGELVKAYSGTTSGVNSVAVSPDGRYIAAVDGGERFPLHMLLWSKDAAEPLRIVDFGRQSRLSAVAFSPSGETLAVAVGNRVQLMSVSR